MSTGRTQRAKRIVVSASAAALAAATLLPTTSHAEPSINEVEDRLDTLYHEAEAAQERLNTINVRLDDKKRRLTVLRSDLREQRTDFRRASDTVAAMAAQEAQNVQAQLSPTQRVLLSEEPGDVLATMGAQQALSDHKGTMLMRFSAMAERLERRERQVRTEVAEVTADRRQAAEEEATVDARVADAEDLLAELEAERRAALRAAEAREEAREQARAAEAQEQVSRSVDRSEPEPSTTTTTEPEAPDVSGGAAAAVDFAMDQVGDAYVYGAAGPDSWDCSGLTMGAWGAAGVSLPHSSSAQMSSGTPVSQSELQPGDLVFYYEPVSHVALYIGNGQIVQASNPSDPVNVASVDSMPYSGAVRPG